MKKLIISALLLLACLARADNVATQSPITMEQLMRELRINGGNWVFHFEEPAYARIDCTVSKFPDGKETETQTFISDSAESIIELYFMVGPWRIGEEQSPDRQNDYTMRIKLSNCRETNGTRLIWFPRKFSQKPWVGQKDAGQLGEYRPGVARYPVLNKEYILYYYYREGDPYEVKATIAFLKKPEDVERVQRFERTEVRRFKNADE